MPKFILDLAKALRPLFLGGAVGALITGHPTMTLVLCTLGLVCNFLSLRHSKQSKYRPIELLDGYLADKRQAAIEQFGRPRPVRTEEELEELLSNLAHPCKLEEVFRPRARIIYLARVKHYDDGSSVPWFAHRDECEGWRTEEISVESGLKALEKIRQAVEGVKMGIPGVYDQWGQVSWMAEACDKAAWVHLKQEIGLMSDPGGRVSLCSISSSALTRIRHRRSTTGSLFLYS